MAKYYLYYDNKNIVRFISNKQTKIDKKIFQFIEVNFTDKQLKEFNASNDIKKIINNKLTFEKPVAEQEKEALIAQVDKATTLNRLKEIIKKII